MIPRARVLGLRLSQMCLPAAAARILTLARDGAAGYVCQANVHMVMEAHDDPAFRAVVNGATLVLPDGKPVAVGLRLTGIAAHQVRGPDLAEVLCALAARRGIVIGLYGGRPEVTAALADDLRRRHPRLRLGEVHSPPFRQATEVELSDLALRLRGSGTRLLLVGLGCPRQERWMAANAQRLGVMCVGVGAWFDFATGTVPEAPRWMRRLGLEWLHRLASEPRRLGPRYLRTNPRFCLLFLAQLLGLDPYRHRESWTAP